MLNHTHGGKLGTVSVQYHEAPLFVLMQQTVPCCCSLPWQPLQYCCILYNYTAAIASTGTLARELTAVVEIHEHTGGERLGVEQQQWRPQEDGDNSCQLLNEGYANDNEELAIVQPNAAYEMAGQTMSYTSPVQGTGATAIFSYIWYKVGYV